MKWLVRIAITLILAAVALAGVILLLPGDKLARLAVDQIRAQTGRELSFSGDVRLTFWPVLGVETGPVVLGNAPWAGEQPMLTASSLAIGVNAPALLAGDVRITGIVAEDPLLRLESSQGRVNWAFTPEGDQPPQTGTTLPAQQARLITLDRLELKNARLILIEEAQTRLDFANVDITAAWPSPDAPLRLQARLPLGVDVIDVDLTLPDLPAFSAGRVVALQMQMSAPGTQIAFDGHAALSGDMSGKASLSTTDSARMLAAFGQSGITLPRGLGQKADVSAQITYTANGQLALRELAMDIDGNRMTGAADITVANPPQVTAKLAAGALDLTGLSTTGASSGAASGAGGWSTVPIDASPLALANGSVRLVAQSIALPGLNLGPSDLTVSLDQRRAVLAMQPVSLFSGQITGQLVANNRNGLSVAGDIRADAVEMREVLSTLAGVQRLAGPASGTLKFLAVGNSEDALMRSLSGEGGLQMGQGVISGIDLDNLMGRGAGGGGTTVFNSLTASYKIEKGNLFNGDLLMLLDNYKANGEGRVGLGARDIDYLFTPVALRANAGQGLAVPVRIVGPWANPAIRPDLTQVIEKATGVNAEQVEEKAKDELRRKLGEELDTEIQPGQDVEELIKDRLQQEATKGLLKLLGKN